MVENSKARIHQFHSGSAPADAITNSMFFVQSLLQRMGFESHIFVEHLAPELGGRLRPLEELRTYTDDLLLIHHSIGHDALPQLLELPCRKFLIYHNITPPEFFSPEDPARHYVLKGYSQLALLRDVVESAIAISPFNAQQLIDRDFERVSVIPLLKDFGAIRYAPHWRTAYHDESAAFRILFVGRIIRHKCQDELIEFISKVRSVRSVPLNLTLVGHFDSADPYKKELDALVRSAELDQVVQFTGRVSDWELFGWYRAASAYVSLSEHEGFGVPLVEAMAFDLPIIAYAAAAVPDTLGGAGISISDKAPKTIHEQLLPLLEDPAYRRDIIRSQRRRMPFFCREHIQARFRDWLIQWGALESAKNSTDGDSEPPPRTQKTHYVIEGPFETSYSLAIVNRNLAFALNNRNTCAGSIEPAEGTEDYRIDEIAFRGVPDNIQGLVDPPPLDAERIVTIRNTFPPRPNGMLGDFRLLHLAWEESSIPLTLAGLINLHLDGVVVPSAYSKRAIRNSGVRVPISVIGHGIDHSGVVPRVPDRMNRGPITPSLPFIFLHISSGLVRKGIDELITAYCLAFSAYDPVLLVIKTYNNESNTIESCLQKPISASRYSPAIQVVFDELDEYQLEFLFSVADAMVLPTRGEGFNLPAAEAMARGLPVIATRHSGHMDFCNEQNSFLIDCTYEMSISHLNVPNSFWVRASVMQLVETMKELYHSGRSPNQIITSRTTRAQQDVKRLRWHDVAAKIDEFVKYLDERPMVKRKLRLAWVSTYNARCGIAAYSQHLLEFFDTDTFEVTIIADDQEAVVPDPDNVKRLWRRGGSGLARVVQYVLTNNFDAVVLQYNLSFFEIDDLVQMILDFADGDLDIFLVLHRTKSLEEHRWVAASRMKQALQSCTGVLVHSVEDLNRLHEGGISDNLILFPHGVMERPLYRPAAVRALLGLSGRTPVIGSFGFLLPGKGLPELIQSFALVLRAYPEAYLLMVNAGYPNAESEEERARCVTLLNQLEIEPCARLINEFLDVEETLFLLSACDVIVFPYQRSDESVSGAAKMGLASGRPVLTTPVPVFADLSEIVYQLPGTGVQEIASGVISFLRDESVKERVWNRQREWVKSNSWATQAQRLASIIQGCVEERRGIRIGPPLARGGGSDRAAGTGSSPVAEASLATMQRFLNGEPHLQDEHRNGHEMSPALSTPPVSITTVSDVSEQAPSFLRRLESLRSRLHPRRGEINFLDRADRAREARSWARAAEFYHKALDQDPDKPAIWVQYGHALKESGKVKQAETAYRKAIDLDGGIADTYLQLGHALKIQGKKIEAGAAYFRALLLDPELEDASLELRGLGWTRGRIRLALQREQDSPR